LEPIVFLPDSFDVLA